MEQMSAVVVLGGVDVRNGAKCPVTIVGPKHARRR